MTFHLAGCSAANVTLGVPRFNEILNASKNQKTNICKVKLEKKTENLQDTRDICRVILEEKFVDQCIDSHKIEYRKYENLSNEDKVWYMCFDMFYNTHYRSCDWSIRLKFNKLTMYQFKLTTSLIASRIESEYKDCRCVYSPDSIGIVDVYVDTSNVDTPSVILEGKKKSRKTKRDEDEDDELRKRKKPLITDDNKDFHFMKGVALDYIMDIKLSGIEGITKVYYRQDPSTKDWVIETEGTNMREIMNHPDIDFRHVSSNNMWEIFGILGIEAARTFLISEITSIISFGGAFIDPAHPTLLADSMTSTGTISSVNRYGIGKNIAGVLTPASFEQSQQTMLDAPVKGLKDDLATVSAAIIVGKHMRIGTGYMDLYTDLKMLKNVNIPKNKEDEFGNMVSGIEVLDISGESKSTIPKGFSNTKVTANTFVFKGQGKGDVIEREATVPDVRKIGEKAGRQLAPRNIQPVEPEYIDF